MGRVRNRKKNRLEEYDYSQGGYYFVTICVQGRRECLGQIQDGEMVLNKYGDIVKEQWLWLANQYAYVQLDEYVVMPNHFHGIICIDVGTGRDLSLPRIKSLSELMGAFKTTSSKFIHSTGFSDFRWQRSFYDHIIRNEQSLNRICQYICDNPAQWEFDRNNPENLPAF